MLFRTPPGAGFFGASTIEGVQEYVLSELDSGERLITERVSTVRSVARVLGLTTLTRCARSSKPFSVVSLSRSMYDELRAPQFVRSFQSPPLTPGRRYAYEVRARWQANGRPVTQSREVRVTAGSNVEVDFPQP